jgi:mono/diheme cytochrome c family protein
MGGGPIVAGRADAPQFFHDRRHRLPVPRVTGSTPSSADGNALPDGRGGRRSLVAALVTLGAAACVVLVLFVLPAAQGDPYVRATLQLEGSVGHGGKLFRLNCAGCHGPAAQGLVGPDLHGVERRKNDRQLIRQVVSGRTPPMPRFQPEPQDMADLLAFLHSLP